MGDSFFGFNTNLPPLSEDEMRALTEQGGGNNNRNQVQNYDHVDADVYDFATLRHELGVHDEPEEKQDGLGDQLIEEGDDNNNMTFGDAPVGKDFDFSGNTQRFSAGISEEEAFYVKRKQQEDHANQGAFRNPWAAPPVRQPVTASGMGRNFGEASPMGPSKSIWGNFGSGLSPGDNGGFSSLSGNPNGLSPFSNANRHPQQQQHQQHQHQQFVGGMSPTTSAGYQQQQQQQQRRPVTLEDIEADMQRQQANRYRNNEPPMNGKTLSLAELEASLARPQQKVQVQGQPQQAQSSQEHGIPPFAYGQPDPMQILAMKQQQEMKEQQLSIARELKRREFYRKSQYDGLMTQHDKDVVNRIQLSQLASGDPYADDFYYQVYSSLRQRAGLPLQSATSSTGATVTTGAHGSTEGGRGRGRREENMMQRMQQQLQRIVNDAKRRPKQTQVSLEGALGKITSLTVRNPRQVLQVPSTSSASSDPNTPTTTTSTADHVQTPNHAKSATAADDKRLVLKITEDMYTLVLEIEQMHRQGPPQSRHNHEDENDEKDRAEAFNEKYGAKVEKLWKTLRLTEAAETPFLISLLSIGKGKKLIPRIVRQLSHDQNLTLLTVFAGNFSKLQVCRHVIYPGTTVANVDEAKKQMFVTFDDVELFMNNTIPPLLGFIAEAPLRIVNGLLLLLLEKNDILTVAQTKPGLAFLTMLLSRAEILKQGGGALQGLAHPPPEETHRWQELYGSLFNTLKGRYLAIFPSLYYLVPINPNTPMMQLSLAVDDIYVWQFLAAMAVGASMDQQHILVTEVRDRVMDNIVLAKRNLLPIEQASHRIANVNLFLHALGLDASQVSVPL
ncbi:hypothetical protein INT47_001433 [Mucor saturninus]|uniref:mRNA decay factor PAT1 domain-containing protein n=1 Tax=Mucor saturninus TaxID=64648 RepID=A0A8H7R0M2_9FUNG|nr:hypothetical protein INT47_001433 [Mucor saturninus]